MTAPRPHAGRRAAAAAAVLALALVVAGCTSHGDDGARSASSNAASGGAGTGNGGNGGNGDGTGGTGEGAGSGSGSGGSRGGSTPLPTPTEPGTEVIPTQTPTPYRLPQPTAAAQAVTPLLSGALPATAAAHGALVAGFPTQAVPVPKGLTIVSSSVASQGDHLQVALQASSRSAPATVNQQLTAAFAQVGYAAAPTAAVAPATATQFSHGTDGVVVTYSPKLGGGTELTLSGTFTAG